MKKMSDEMSKAVQLYRYGDSVVGEVVDYDNEKCYVRVSESDAVVSYRGCGEKGDIVMLSVKWSDLKRREVMCQLDSVLSYADAQEDYYKLAS